MKDNFSSNSSQYAKYRPSYPKEIFQLVEGLLASKENAWDCGTGNGQVAAELAKIFREVKATDISASQLRNAVQKPNIQYTVQPAEKTNFPDDHFDLITVAQAIHWFNFNDFYKEVKRCLKQQGILLVLGYGLFRSNRETERIISHFYENIIGAYWDPERRHLDEEYKKIPFPFRELDFPDFVQEVNWEFDHLTGYLRTWSAVKHYREQEGKDPVELIEKELREAFGQEGTICFPILIRIGSVD